MRSTLRSNLNLARVRSTKLGFVSERFLSRARPARRQDGILCGILPTARKRKCFRRKPEFPTETVTAEGGLKGVTGWVCGRSCRRWFAGQEESISVSDTPLPPARRSQLFMDVSSASAGRTLLMPEQVGDSTKITLTLLVWGQVKSGRSKSAVFPGQ